MKQNSKYNSRLLKGGALIPEMRALLRIWEPSADSNGLVKSLIQENILAKRTRSRMEDILREVFIPRYVNGNPPEAWQFLQPLERAMWPTEHMRLLLYYHAAKSESLLYDFVITSLFDQYYSGAVTISVSHVLAFLRQAMKERKIHSPWSESVSIRVAQGLLAALRDFGLLMGKKVKRIQRPAFPIPSFVYIAFLIKREVASGQRVLEHPDWRLFLLNPPSVERLFLEAHQEGCLQYHALGNIIRIDFKHETMEELIHGVLAAAP
ncbi:MAG: DUF1819 family protein [Deltaproteobacteria bacterium]|nr:DUF1819 family protein [Deltaproteobacteria bacterium]